MAEKRHNKKAPKSKVCEKKVEPKWYHTHVDRKKTGGHTMYYDDPDDHKKYYHEQLHSSCSYKVTEADDDDKEINHNLNVGELRNYVGGGVSNHSDSHSDTNSEGTFRVESAHDFGQASGRHYYRGTKQQEIKVKGQEHHSIQGGKSKGTSDYSVNGTRREKYKEDHFTHVEGDRVSMGEKNEINVFQKDVATYAGENWDTYVKQKGKIETGGDFKLTSGAKIEETAKNEYTMSSDQKIVIKVGQSKITIESGEIKIEGAKVTVKADGQVDIKGAATMIQGGGQVAPPTTFK